MHAMACRCPYPRVMRALGDEKLLPCAGYRCEPHHLAAARKAAFLHPPMGAIQD